PLPTERVGLTHLPMSAPSLGIAPWAAVRPGQPVQKVVYWLQDLFAAPGRAYAQGYQAGYQAGYGAGYEAGRLSCVGGGNAYDDRPRSIYEFRDLFKPPPERYAALFQRYAEGGLRKRPVREWLDLMRTLPEEHDPGAEGG
ncbi:hypothetical protein, partial [Thermus scotoductus]|uniref:hypothetical protein n=1 Tax=Thermus scotoductus TaxID=37636 RepID=UPI001C12B43E